jgi:hypothetical protein
VNSKALAALMQSQRRQKTWDAEHVIEVTVSKQQSIEPPEAGSAPQQLALCAFPAIHQDPIATDLDQKACMVAFCRRDACRRPKKGQIEHGGPEPFVFDVARGSGWRHMYTTDLRGAAMSDSFCHGT